MTITAITYPVNDDTFGSAGATEAEAAGYRVYLADYLRAEYPQAHILIDKSDTAQLRIETSDDPADCFGLLDEVRFVAEKAWNACKWEWATTDAR